MNKKAQSFMIGLMVFIMAFIALLQFIEPMKDQIVEARSASSLNCSSTDISTARRSTCLLVDFSLPYYIGVGLFAAFTYLAIKNFGDF